MNPTHKVGDFGGDAALARAGRGHDLAVVAGRGALRGRGRRRLVAHVDAAVVLVAAVEAAGLGGRRQGLDVGCRDDGRYRHRGGVGAEGVVDWLLPGVHWGSWGGVC